MKKILNAIGRFFRTMVRSCYDMELYRQIRTAPWTKAFYYFILFSLFIVVTTLFDVAPSAWSGLKQARQYVVDQVPAGASVAIKAGQMETNLPSPTYLGNDQLAFVIDASVSGLAAQPDIESGSGFVLGRDVLVVQESAAERRIIALSELPDLTVTKEAALSWFDRYGRWVVAAAALFFGLAYLLASLSGGVMFVLLASLIAALFGALWRVRLRFGQWVAIGFHAVTLPTLANALFGAFGLDVPLVFTFLYFMVVVAVIADERAAPTSAVLAAPDVAASAAPPRSPPGEPVAAPSVPGPAKPKPAARKPAKPRVRKKNPPPSADGPAQPPV